MSTQLNFDSKFPDVQQEPKIADVLSDLKSETIIAVDQLLVDYEYSMSNTKLGSSFKWMPDLFLESKVFPVESTATLLDNLGGVDTCTLTKGGLVTFTGAMAGNVTLMKRYTIGKVTSIREAYLSVQMPLAEVIAFMTTATIGTSIGNVTLRTSAGVEVRTQRITPGVKSSFGYDVLQAAGDGCYIEVILAGKVVAAASWQIESAGPTVIFGLDLKNRVEGMLYPALITGGSILASETLIPLVLNLIERYSSISEPVQRLISLAKGIGINLTALAASVAASFAVAYDNDSSFELSEMFDIDNFMMMLSSLVTIAISNIKPLAISMVTAMVSPYLGNSTLSTLTRLAGNVVGNYMFVISILAYVTTCRIKEWV